MTSGSSRWRATVVLVAVAVMGVISVLTAGAAQGAGPRPLFQLPFRCGEVWRLATYPGHDDYDIDMTATTGSTAGRPILASYGGSVGFAGWDSGGGWMVRLNHGGGWSTLYLHMVERPAVSTGQSVSRGQRLGRVGSTGDSSGPHLHYEQLRDGAKTESYFNGQPSGITHDNSSYSVTRQSYNCGGAADRERVSDFSGDGASDVLGVAADGRLLYYPNNGQRLSSSVEIGHGWGGFSQVMAADFSGDGAADVLGVAADGRLLYYPNNGQRLSSAVEIGHGWGAFSHVMASDFNGDGDADVLGVAADSRLLYYRNDNQSLSSSVEIGHGWGTFIHVM